MELKVNNFPSLMRPKVKEIAKYFHQQKNYCMYIDFTKKFIHFCIKIKNG